MAINWTTKLIHPESRVPAGFRSLATPVFRGSTTLFERADAIADTWNHDEQPYTYGSYGTPTSLELAARVAALEGGFRCFLTPSGQAALIAVYFSYLSTGDHVLIPDNVYGPSRGFADAVLRRFGIDVEFYPGSEGAAVGRRIRGTTRLIWCESPGSITMEVQDVPAIVAAARERNVAVALDNTWSAGVFFDAFRHGVALSVQAITKYIGGHSDVLLGAITVRDERTYELIGPVLNHLGTAVSPDDCALAIRGLQTLEVRLKAIERAALAVARWFAARGDVERVLHPALPSCPGHDLWQRDFTGSSGLFAVVFRAPWTRAQLHAAMDRLTLFKMGYSWGGVTSLVVTADLDDAPNARAYGERLLRFSIGLEHVDDLIADLTHAFGVSAPVPTA